MTDFQTRRTLRSSREALTRGVITLVARSAHQPMARPTRQSGVDAPVKGVVMQRFVSALLVALIAVSLSAGAVLAAPPSNDTYASAIAITTIPFSDTVDTTEATTDGLDEELNAQCGAPATDASVWYTLTAPADTQILVDASGSDYSTGVLVATGSPGGFEVIACGPQAVSFSAAAGVSYTLLIFDAQEDGGGNGGNLQLVVGEAPPPPEVDVAVDAGSFDPRAGTATVTGTVTCSVGTGAFISVQLSQRVGRFIIRGFGDTFVECDGTAQRWTAEVFGETGVFRGGRARVQVFAETCSQFDCSFDSAEADIRLKRER